MNKRRKINALLTKKVKRPYFEDEANEIEVCKNKTRESKLKKSGAFTFNNIISISSKMYLTERFSTRRG